LANGLIFLFSPRELPNIFGNELANYNKKFPTSGVTTSRANNYTTIFETLTNVIEVFRLLKSSTNGIDKLWNSVAGEPKIEIPVAFCISWYDVIEHKFYNSIPKDTDKVEMSAIVQDKQIKYEPMLSYSNEIKELLYNDETGNIRLKNKIETSFKNYLYFAVQTIKEIDQGDKNYPESRGCLLPVLWMLNHLKIID
jgi:hypothetical protein